MKRPRVRITRGSGNVFLDLHGGNREIGVREQLIDSKASIGVGCPSH